ncbi:Arabinose operon regulatory protein [compost metagenome]
MECEVLLCGYSFHSKKFRLDQQSGVDSYFFRLQTEGEGQAYVQGQWKQLIVGDLLLCKPTDPFALLVEDPMDPGKQPLIASGDYYIYCRGAWIEKWWNERERPHQVNIPLDERLIQIWRQLILEKRRFGKENKQLSAYLLQALCLTLDRAIEEEQGNHYPRQSYTATRMKTYIEEHATKLFKIEDVAKHVGLSASRSMALYKECYGTTMIQYALEVRLSVALERIKYSKLSFEVIAETSGFQSYAYFHRVFRERFGLSPTEYIEKHRIGRGESEKVD